MTSHHNLKGANAATWWKRAKSGYSMSMEDMYRDSENLAARMISDAKSIVLANGLAPDHFHADIFLPSN